MPRPKDKPVATAAANADTFLIDGAAGVRALSKTNLLTDLTNSLPVVTPGAKGLTPPSGGGTTKFLRSDLTWVTPPVGEGGTADPASVIELQERIPPIAPVGYAFGVMDSFDRYAFAVQDDGTFEAARAEIGALFADSIEATAFLTPNGGINTDNIPGFALPIIDSAGRVAGGVKDDGTLRFKRGDIDVLETSTLQADTLNGVDVADILAGGASAPPPVMPAFQADIIGHYACGQSLSEGVHATPAISTVAKYNNVRFNTAVTVRGGPVPTSFVPLTELTFNDGNNGETPVTGACECAIQLIQQENFLSPSDYTPFFFGAATGVSATTVAQLSKGSSGGGYDICILATNYAMPIATGLNKTFKVGSISWTQGTSDYMAGTTQATYRTQLQTLLNDLNTDIKALTGQTDDIYMLCGQSPDHVFSSGGIPRVALAQLELSKIDPRFVLACSMYVFPPTDYPHLTAVGAKWLGAYYGLAHKRVAMDGEVWKPLDCTTVFRQGKVVHLTFNVPVGSLTFDTTQIPLRTNYGFTLVDSGGSNLSIASVTITGPNTIRIVASSNIPTGAKARYGWPIYDGVQSGGNLRDEQGDDIVFDTSGINKRLDNWCVIFEKAL